MAGILTNALHFEGGNNKNLQGAVSEAAKLSQQLGTECHAVVVGEGISDEAASSLGQFGGTKVFRVEAPEGLSQPVIDAMSHLFEANGYDYALFGGGLLGF